MKIKELRGMTIEELIRQHDAIEGDLSSTPRGMFLDELHRREMMEQGERMEKLTRSINWLTRVVTIATVIGVCLTAYSLFP